MANQQEGNSFEVVTGGALEALQRGEVESQISIAKRYPRKVSEFVERAVSIACIDEETAASCLYHRPVGRKDGKVEYADGMSIRMAEIVGASYGNIRVYAMLIDQTERQVVARGMAIDLEHNFASSSEIVESTITSDGRPYSERMRTVVAKAALAKARRDATFQVVPRALAKPVEAAVRKLLVGDAKSIEQRRKVIEGWINSLGIDSKRVFSALGVGGLGDVGVKEMETLTGLRTAIKDGETSIDEAFPHEAIKQPTAAAPAAPADEPKKTRRKAAEPEPTKPEQATAPAPAAIDELLEWISKASDDDLFAEPNWLLGQINRVSGSENQLKVLRAFNDTRDERRKKK